MKSNRPNASAMPVPRSSPLLSSSFTPFYPRSQQQLYNAQLDPPGNQDGGFHASPQKSDDIIVDKGHPYAWSRERGPKFYDQQYYASSGTEPYEVPWMSNNGNVWGGGAWQWGDPGPVEYAYADDDGENSAYLLSDSLSYYAESPALEQEFYACSTGNIESVSAPFSDQGATAAFSVFHGTAMPEQASFLPKTKESLTPSVRELSTKEQAVSVCPSEKQGPANGTRNEIANAPTSSKLDARPFSIIQVSSQMGSSIGISSRAIEPRLKQGATDVAENKRARTESSELSKNSCKLSIEEGSVVATASKHSIYATSTPPNTRELMEGTNLDSPTVPVPAKVIQKEVSSINSLSFQSGFTQLQPTGGQFPIMKPKPVNAQACCSSLVQTVPLEQMNKGSVLSKASLGMEMEGKPRAEAIVLEAMPQENTSSSYCLPGDAGLCSNGPQLLVKSIHNLSKVLLSIQSGSSLNNLDPIDCLAIENTIYMLSHRLFQSSVNEADFYQDRNCYQVAEQELKSSDDSMKSYREAGSEAFLQKSSRLLTSMKPKVETVFPKQALENEAWENSSKVTARSCGGGDEKSDQSSSVKKHFEEPLQEILMLQGEVRKLQEEVTYERAESNATVMIYKKLWSEAEEALKVSRSEVREIKAELAGFNREFGNMKLSEGSGGPRSMLKNLELTKCDKNTHINQGGVHENFSDMATSSSTAPDLRRAPNGNENGAFGGSPTEHLPESDAVLTGYFDPGNIPNCRENWTLSKGEKASLRHFNQAASSNQDGNKFEVSASEPSSKHTFDEVTQRLSLLMARQGLDLNKACTKEHLPESDEALTGYFDPGNIPNCRENWTPRSKDEKASLSYNNQAASSNQDGNKFEVSASEPSSNHTFRPPPNLEDEMTGRLSLLLARQCLDLNKSCTDRNVESPSNLSTFLEPKSNLPRESEAMPPDKSSHYLSWSETSYMVNANKGLLCVKADLISQMKSDLEVKNGQHCLVEREPHDRASGVNVEEVKVSACQEDEIEIICFKPGVADSSFTCLKGEPEWEHVVVNALDDHKLNSIISQNVN